MSKKNAVNTPVATPVSGRRRLPPGRERLQLRSERVEAKLRAMPAWRKVYGGRAIEQVRTYTEGQGAAVFAGYVTGLAGLCDQPARITLIGGRVKILLFSLGFQGQMGELTEETVDFAASLT